jgi:hypothetical protein
LEILRTVATVAGPLIGVTGLILGFIYFKKSKEHKELTYEISLPFPLVQVGSAIKGKVKVEYDGEPIENLIGVSVEIRCSGTEDVAFRWGADTEERPLTIDFGEGARILGEPTVATTPKYVKASAVKDPKNPTRVILNKFLIKPGQRVTVTTLLTNYPEESLDVYGQLKGVRRLQGRTQIEAESGRGRELSLHTLLRSFS